MKKILVLILSFVLCSCATMYTTLTENINLLAEDALELSYRGETYQLPLKDGGAYYVCEYSVPNIGADTLYSVTRLVMPDIFNSAESVIQMEDSNLKTIVGKGKQTETFTFPYGGTTIHNIFYTLRIQCYDNKIKISVYNFSSQVPYSFGYASGTTSVSIEDAVTRGVNGKREILDNGYGAFIFAVYNTGNDVLNVFINTAEKYLKENFNIE